MLLVGTRSCLVYFEFQVSLPPANKVSSSLHSSFQYPDSFATHTHTQLPHVLQIMCDSMNAWSSYRGQQHSRSQWIMILKKKCALEPLEHCNSWFKSCFRHWYAPSLLRCVVLPSVSMKPLRRRLSTKLYQCVDKPTRCNTSYEWSLLSINWLHMFRTITSPSSGASSHTVYNALVCVVLSGESSCCVDVHPRNS